MLTSLFSLLIAALSVSGEGGFRRVLTGISPLIPNPSGEELLINHDDKAEVVYMDKECVKTAANSDDEGVILAKAEEFRQGLLKEEKDCLVENDVNNVVNVNYEDFYFFLKWDSEFEVPNPDDGAECASISIDMEKFCISKVEYEPIMQIEELFHPSCAQQTGAWWSLADIESETDFAGYAGYHFSAFQNENIIVYVLDEPINFNHEQFSHLVTRTNLGGYTGNLGNHGSHVAGTIIGKDYGILRDTTIPLKGYGICGTNGCPWSYITAALNAVINDLKANPTKRGVINMSIGGYCGAGCNWYDSLFDQINSNNGILVVAAGNENADSCLVAPAYSDKAITVGAYGDNHQRASFSNWGACINAWGPGVNIQSAYYSGLGNMQGTSMASPAISGIVGGLLAANDALNLAEIKAILKCSHHSDVISDCKNSATCNGYSASCGDLYTIASSATCETPANVIDFGQLVTGTIKSYEKAYYRVEIGSEHADDSVLFSVCGSAFDTRLYLYDANFNMVAQNDDANAWHGGCGLQGSLFLSTLAVGDYWIAVGGYSSRSGAFRLAMANGEIDCGETVTGTINSYEKHYYAIFPDASKNMIAKSCGSAYDTYLYLYNDDFSTVLGTADDQGDCSLQGEIPVPPSYGGIRYLGVGGYSASSGRYTVELVCSAVGAGGGYDDFRDYRYMPQLKYFGMIPTSVWIIMLLVINIMCIAMYCTNKTKKKMRYKTVSMVDVDSSDLESQPIKY